MLLPQTLHLTELYSVNQFLRASQQLRPTIPFLAHIDALHCIAPTPALIVIVSVKEL